LSGAVCVKGLCKEPTHRGPHGEGFRARRRLVGEGAIRGERSMRRQRGQQPGAAPALAGLLAGQRVWVEGREARFLYRHPAGAAAVIRYLDEKASRVMAVRRIDLERPKATGANVS
jgi:hypothetical protein